MNALVLCAGRGTRLGELTRETPKPLLPVGGVPLLDRTLFWLQAAGVAEILVNMHHAPAAFDPRIDFHGSGRVRYVPEPSLLGTAGAARAYMGILSRGEPLLIVYGDVLFHGVDLPRFLAGHAPYGPETAAVLGTTWVEECAGRSRVVRTYAGRVLTFEEKPAAGPGECFAGLMLASAAALAMLPERTPLDFGGDVFPGWVEARTLAARGLDGLPIDIGTPAGYALAERWVAE